MVQGQTYVEDFLGFIKGRLHLELTKLTLDSSGFGIPMDSARRNDDGHISTDIHHWSTYFCTEYWRYLQRPLWSFKGWVGYSQLEETHHGPKDVIEILRTFSAANGTSPALFCCEDLWGSVRHVTLKPFETCREREVTWNTHVMQNTSQRNEKNIFALVTSKCNC